MADESPIAASRFGISIDGVQVANFAELKQSATAGGLPRKLLAQDLTHVVTQSGRGQPLSFIAGKIGGSAANRSLATVRRGSVRITGFDPRGRAVGAIAGPATIGPTAGSQQEWSITYESIQRVL